MTDIAFPESVPEPADQVANLPTPQPERPTHPPSPLEERLAQHEARQALRSAAARRESVERYRTRNAFVVRDDTLAYPPLEQLRDLHHRLNQQLHDDIAAGVTVHRRLPPVFRALPCTVALLDGLILYSFCADIFDAELIDASRQSLAALALAVLGSGIAFTLLSLTGYRLRDYRNRLGEISWRQLGRSTWLLVAGSAIITLALAELMFARVREQAGLAGAAYVATGQVTVLAGVFAVLSAVANLTVVTVHALDGSALAAHARQAGAAVRRAERQLDRLRHDAWRRAMSQEPCLNPLGEEDGGTATRRP